MDDTTNNIQSTTDAFNDLSDDDFASLEDLNTRIQTHTGPWGEIRGGVPDGSGVIEMPYSVLDPLINEFVSMWYEKDLVILFDWASWQEGRDWYANENDAKYETALKLLTAVIRNNQFNEGALLNAFESGVFPKIINKLIG
jgi:hypothetical protein